ncbi:DNA (cytosine-5)-methyltransferase 3B-like isoform X1 [Gossypium australe]|uniref:DNA (Cytosine-5)-methyltransferase 3B-like isoform X1 n=1 Tax=Gossypium australe TaxID=47621 RepID=A0A5B6UCN0_9ROSI|nr:DNA (cytosine-5)-methyltransferase 3B-like isoform X1 [Gossypium australe]
MHLFSILAKTIVSESQKRLPPEDKSGAGIRIHDNNGGEESAAVRFEGEVSLGDLIWLKLLGKTWWPAVVVDERSVSKSSKPGKKSKGEVLVRLYGSHDSYADPMKYRSEFKTILEQNNGSYYDILEKGLEQFRSRLKSSKSKGQGSKATGLASLVCLSLFLIRLLCTVLWFYDMLNAIEAKNQELQTLLLLFSPKQKSASHSDLYCGLANTRAEEKETTKKKNPQQKGSNVEEKASKKLKRKSPSTDKQGKKKADEQERSPKKQKKNNQTVEPNSRTAKAKPKSSTSKEQKKSKASKQGKEQKKPKRNKLNSIDTKSRTSKEKKLLEETDDQSSEGSSLGESPKSGARRTRVMQGLGLIAPPGSPFHKNGLI